MYIYTDTYFSYNISAFLNTTTYWETIYSGSILRRADTDTGENIPHVGKVI